jgi:hypothetical protein
MSTLWHATQTACHLFFAAGDRRLQIRNHESFMLSAESAEDLETWVSVINRIIREPLGGGMFGREVARTVKQEARQIGGGSVPIIVQKAVMFLRDKGLNELGLFRLPGSQVKVQALKESFDKGENPDLFDCEEVHSVASLLKLYLRQLPEPLIPFEFFDMFISAACVLDKDEEEGVQQLGKQLKLLPEENLKLLKYMCQFLFEFQTHSANTKMDLANVATVFGPNFIRPQSNDPQSMMENTSLMTTLTKALIKHEQHLFQEVDNSVHLPNRLISRENNNSKTAGMSTGPPDLHHHYDELPSRDFRTGTAPSSSLHRLKDRIDERLVMDGNAGSLDKSPFTVRRQTAAEPRGSSGSDGISAKTNGKPLLLESSDSDSVEDTFPPYAVIQKPEKSIETQELKLQELREEVKKLKKSQAETAEQVDELRANLDLEMKARVEGEKLLRQEQKRREAWEMRYKQEAKFREDLERRCKELQEQLDQVYETFSST